MEIRLAELRKESGKTQLAVASDLGIEQSALSKYENGSVDLRPKQLDEFSRYYHVPIEYIIGTSDNRCPYNELNMSDYRKAKEEAGAYLRCLIDRRYPSIRMFGKKAGVQASYICRITKGDYALTPEKARAFSEYLDLSREDILTLYDKVAKIGGGSLPYDVTDFLLSTAGGIEFIRFLEEADDPEGLMKWIMESGVRLASSEAGQEIPDKENMTIPGDTSMQRR